MKASHVREWQEQWPSGLGVLYDMPHNRGEDHAGIARAGWPFVVSVVVSMAEGKGRT